MSEVIEGAGVYRLLGFPGPFPDSVKWSPNNLLAVANTSFVTIFVSTHVPFDVSMLFVQSAVR